MGAGLKSSFASYLASNRIRLGILLTQIQVKV